MHSFTDAGDNAIDQGAVVSSNSEVVHLSKEENALLVNRSMVEAGFVRALLKAKFVKNGVNVCLPEAR